MLPHVQMNREAPHILTHWPYNKTVKVPKLSTALFLAEMIWQFPNVTLEEEASTAGENSFSFIADETKQWYALIKDAADNKTVTWEISLSTNYQDNRVSPMVLCRISTSNSRSYRPHSIKIKDSTRSSLKRKTMSITVLMLRLFMMRTSRLYWDNN